MFSALTTDTWLYAHRVLDRIKSSQARTLARLASGTRLNTARDDVAGVAIASRMQARNRSLAVDLRNVNDMVSLAQVADGALGSIGDNLQRIRELAVQAANGTNNENDRTALDAEANQLIDASRRIQATTEFNGRALLDGTFQTPGGGTDSGPAVSFGSVFHAQTTDVLFRYIQLSQAVTTVTPTGALSAGDLTINGHAVGASAAGSGAGQDAGSAWAIANAINGTAIENLTATANTTTISGSAMVFSSGSTVAAGDIVINGVAVKAGNVVNAINNIAGQTGVSARLSSGTTAGTSTLILEAGDGRSIDVSGAGAFGVADTHVVGTITVTGPLAERPKSNLVIGGANPGNAGFSTTAVAAVDTGDPVYVPLDEDTGFDQNPDLRTADGAKATISLMDRKLNKLLLVRTQVGALLNVLDARAENLSASREAGMASESRLRDTDYASEMAQWTKDKLLQDTASAMMTQANVESGQALLLLVDNATNGGGAQVQARA